MTMSTLLIHQIEPFFCSTTTPASTPPPPLPTTDHHHLSFPVSTLLSESLVDNHFTIYGAASGGNNSNNGDSSPVCHHLHLHDDHHQNNHITNNGNYHQLLTNITTNNNNTNSRLDGNLQNHHHLENQSLLQHYDTTTTVTSNVADFSNVDILLKSSDDHHFIVDEYNNLNNNNNNEHSISCIPCILDDYVLPIEHSPPCSSSSSSSPCSWSVKSPDQWLPSEVAEWIRCWAERNEVQDIEVAHLLYNQMAGIELCQMQREYFTTVCPQYGDLIYDSLQSLIEPFRSSNATTTTTNNNTATATTTTCFTYSIQPNNPNNNNSFSDHLNNEKVSPEGLEQQDHLLPVIDLYSNNNTKQMMSSSTSIFEAQQPHITTITTHDHIHQHHLEPSPIYTNAFDSDRESTSSTYSEQKISLVGSYYSSPTSSIVNNDNNHSQHQESNYDLNEHIHVSSLKHHHHHHHARSNGKRGRPPKKENKSRSKGNGKLWEFIRDLLLNPVTNPSLIRWERQEDGIFKFIQSDKVAKMWGERKQNPRMTYEKLSRAMRYYYKSQVLLPVFGRRLVYKFGPNATGWRPSSSLTHDNIDADYSTSTICDSSLVI